MIEYQAGDIWKCMGKMDDGEFLILAVNEPCVSGFWLLDKGYGDDYDTPIGNKYVNPARMYTMRLNALMDFIRSVSDEKLEEVRDVTAKAMGLNRVVITGEVRQEEKDDGAAQATIIGLQKDLVRMTAQRDVYKELYLKREGME